MFYFIRHGQTDYSERNTKIYQGFGVNLSRLSPTGIQQIKEAARDKRLKDADIILSSGLRLQLKPIFMNGWPTKTIVMKTMIRRKRPTGILPITREFTPTASKSCGKIPPPCEIG